MLKVINSLCTINVQLAKYTGKLVTKVQERLVQVILIKLTWSYL